MGLECGVLDPVPRTKLFLKVEGHAVFGIPEMAPEAPAAAADAARWEMERRDGDGWSAV